MKVDGYRYLWFYFHLDHLHRIWCWNVLHFRLWNLWIQTDPVDGRGIEKINETLTHIKFFRQDRLLSATTADFNVDCDWAPTRRLDFCILLPKSPRCAEYWMGLELGNWPTAFSSWYPDGGNSNIFYFHHDLWGFMIQLDERAYFSNGLNHQLDTYLGVTQDAPHWISPTSHLFHTASTTGSHRLKAIHPKRNASASCILGPLNL